MICRPEDTTECINADDYPIARWKLVSWNRCYSNLTQAPGSDPHIFFLANNDNDTECDLDPHMRAVFKVVDVVWHTNRLRRSGTLYNSGPELTNKAHHSIKKDKGHIVSGCSRR